MWLVYRQNLASLCIWAVGRWVSIALPPETVIASQQYGLQDFDLPIVDMLLVFRRQSERSLKDKNPMNDLGLFPLRAPAHTCTCTAARCSSNAGH